MSKKLIILSLSLIFVVTDLYADALSTYPLRRVKISNTNFVFIETQGNIEDNFEDKKKDMVLYASKYGISTYRTAILYLDDYAPANNRNFSKNEKRLSNITKEDLIKWYGIPYLESQRSVLVGVLLYPNYSIRFSDEVKVFNLQNISPFMFQAIAFYGDVDPNMEPDPNNPLRKYTQEDRIYDRTSMLRYMRSNSKSSKYIGMMELEDNVNNTITFIALEGNKEEFYEKYAIKPIGN